MSSIYIERTHNYENERVLHLDVLGDANWPFPLCFIANLSIIDSSGNSLVNHLVWNTTENAKIEISI